MSPVIANFLMRAGTRFWLLLISLAAAAIMFEGICEQIIRTWIKRSRGRNWPTVSAVIDIVSVTFAQDDHMLPPIKATPGDSYYLAQLTYVYHNPDLQMGEYNRRLGNKQDAEAWANSYKGETVKVHVDPRDPTRSVLREEDL